MHWLLALSTITAFATHEGGGVWATVHEWAGYVAMATALVRVVFGFTGKGVWRFDSFVQSLSHTLAYAKAMVRGKERRFLGHNPLGALMVLALLGNALACGLTGWLYTTDRFWGVAWLGDLHGFLGELFVPLVVLHLAGVAWASWKHRESLVGAMFHGNKRDSHHTNT